MACDLWLVPLVDVLSHSPDNPFRDDLALYNRVLADNGLPEMPVYRYVPGLSGAVEPIAAFDYDSLHFLRRAYLLGLTGLDITPVDALGGDYEQLLEMFESSAEQSHLVWHFDHAGAYVPIEFAAPLVEESLLASGGPLGSSHGLLRELQAVAPALGIDPLDPCGTDQAARSDRPGAAVRSAAGRPAPVRPGAARLGGPVRGGDPEPAPGLDGRLRLSPIRSPGPSPGPSRSRSPGPSPWPQATARTAPGPLRPAPAYRSGPSGGRWRGMVGLAPGGGSTRTWAPTPGSVRPPQLPEAWVGSRVIPARNSSIHSEVSVRTMSETSSQNRRSTPRHRSAASPAVPSVGPSTSRTHSDAQSNWKASKPALQRLRGGDVAHPAGGQSERPVRAVAGVGQRQPDVAPVGGVGDRPGEVDQRGGDPADREAGRAEPQQPGPAALPDPVPAVPVDRLDRPLLGPAVQLLQPLRGLAPVPERELAGAQVGPVAGRRAGREGRGGRILLADLLAPGTLLGLHFRLAHLWGSLWRADGWSGWSRLCAD